MLIFLNFVLFVVPSVVFGCGEKQPLWVLNLNFKFNVTVSKMDN